MQPLRSLRGECQHGDLSEALKQGYGGPTLEPTVNAKWCPEELRVSDYVVMSKDRTLELLAGVAAVVIQGPEDAVKP